MKLLSYSTSDLVKCMVVRKRLYIASFFPSFTKTINPRNKSDKSHRTKGGLSSGCTKLEPASSKINEILKINLCPSKILNACYIKLNQKLQKTRLPAMSKPRSLMQGLTFVIKDLIYAKSEASILICH